jgi:hypothetical protein
MYQMRDYSKKPITASAAQTRKVEEVHPNGYTKANALLL